MNTLATNNNATLFQFLNVQWPQKYSMAWVPQSCVRAWIGATT